MRAITLFTSDSGGACRGDHAQHRHAARQRLSQMLPEDTTMRVNVMGNYVVLDACAGWGLKRLCLPPRTTRSRVGGMINRAKPFEVKYLPIDEEHPLFNQDT